MAEVTTINVPQGDNVTTTLNGAISNSATSFTIGTGLTLDANGGFLQINYDSVAAVGASDSPETVSYTGYSTSTGAVTGVTRAQAATTAVAHSNGATVMCGMSAKYLMNGTVLGLASSTSAQATITSVVDLTNLSIAVTVPAGGRRIKITGFVRAFATSVPAAIEVSIKEGATVLNTFNQQVNIASLEQNIMPLYIGTPTAASHTYKLTIAQTSGAGSVSTDPDATHNHYILVELL